MQSRSAIMEKGDISINSSLPRKLFFAVMRTISDPRSSVSWVIRGHLARDAVFVGQTYWVSGSLPRVPLSSVIPGVAELEITLPRAFDRLPGTSVTVDEACHLAAIVKGLGARRVLEIGTYDGNSTLVLASNIPRDGEVITVDLAPDFDVGKRETLTYTDGELNLTAREHLGRQIATYRPAHRIRQVYGDSAELDWGALGGPFDLIFLDGCHSEAYVRSDSRKALDNLASNGAVVWHDYGMIPEVSCVVDDIARESGLTIRALEGTRLAIAMT